MKTILKTIPPKLNMNYEEMFNSQLNIKIWRQLILELVKALKPKYCASSDQISNWLQSLHRFQKAEITIEIKDDSTVIIVAYMPMVV